MCERTVCVNLCVCECMFVMNTTAVIEVDCGGTFGQPAKEPLSVRTHTHAHTYTHSRTVILLLTWHAEL